SPAVAGGESLRPLRRSARLAWVVAGVVTGTAIALGLGYSRRSDPERPVMRTAITAPKDTSFDFDTTVGPAVLWPDGRMVAFSARPSAGQIRLWIRPLDGLDARPLEGTEGASFPFWSPDSRSVGYYSAARGRLERVEVAGGAPVVIARGGFVR